MEIFMVLEFINNNGAKYIRIVENKYVSKNGKPSCKNNVLLNVGPLSRFDDGKPDHVTRLKKSFKNGNPLIPSLSEYVNRKPVRNTYDISFKEGDPDCIGHTKLFSVYSRDIIAKQGTFLILPVAKPGYSIFDMLIYGSHWV